MEVPTIVSLTTIAQRLASLPAVLKSLLTQTQRPDRLVLNISAEPYMLDSGIGFENLPTEVREMIVAGSVEAYRVRNIGSYRKLLPTLGRLAGDEAIIVTADDDVLYPERWLEGLWKAHAANSCIAAYRTREIRLREGGGVRPYEEWPYTYELPETAGKPSMYRVPTGRGGVLYRASYFSDLKLLERFRQIAPAQDDMSFRLASMVAGIPVVWIPYIAESVQQKEFYGFHSDESLFARNSSRSAETTPNDSALHSLLTYCRDQGLIRPQLASLLPA